MKPTSAAACIEAGYDLLHLDLAAGPLGADAPLPIDTLIDQTVILLHHAESVRRAQDRAPIAYEVDTDEARGGLQDEDRMRTFLRRLRTALDDRDLPDPSRGSSSGRCSPIAVRPRFPTRPNAHTQIRPHAESPLHRQGHAVGQGEHAEVDPLIVMELFVEALDRPHTLVLHIGIRHPAAAKHVV